MRSCVVSVMDLAVAAYARPIFVPTVSVALRSFGDEINRKSPDNAMSQHPDDYILWYIADFDEESGLFSVPEGGPRVLIRGKDVNQS